MAVTSNDIANQAIQLIGDNQPPVTGFAPTFDDSAAGVALQSLYVPTVATVARLWNWDFARKQAALVLSGNAAPLGWLYEYLYPANGIEVWQLLPAVVTDANNPLPLNWVVGNTLVAATPTKVIWSDTQNVLAVFNSNPVENLWDALFRETMVRTLASALANGIAGRPDAAQILLDTASAFKKAGEMRMG